MSGRCALPLSVFSVAQGALTLPWCTFLQAELYNDGVVCDTNCGIFDPDCGRVRSNAKSCITGTCTESADGLWYINPSLKQCTANAIVRCDSIEENTDGFAELDACLAGPDEDLEDCVDRLEDLSESCMVCIERSWESAEESAEVDPSLRALLDKIKLDCDPSGTGSAANSVAPDGIPCNIARFELELEGEPNTICIEGVHIPGTVCAADGTPQEKRCMYTDDDPQLFVCRTADATQGRYVSSERFDPSSARFERIADRHGDTHDTADANRFRFAWVTWDNIDLDRDGAFEFVSGDIVPAGTQISLDGGTYYFDPYEWDHNGDDLPDVPVSQGTSVPEDMAQMPIHTPPYHPAMKARFAIPARCVPNPRSAAARAWTSEEHAGYCEPYGDTLDLGRCVRRVDAPVRPGPLARGTVPGDYDQCIIDSGKECLDVEDAEATDMFGITCAEIYSEGHCQELQDMGYGDMCCSACSAAPTTGGGCANNEAAAVAIYGLTCLDILQGGHCQELDEAGDGELCCQSCSGPVRCDSSAAAAFVGLQSCINQGGSDEVLMTCVEPTLPADNCIESCVDPSVENFGEDQPLLDILGRIMSDCAPGDSGGRRLQDCEDDEESLMEFFGDPGISCQTLAGWGECPFLDVLGLGAVCCASCSASAAQRVACSTPGECPTDSFCTFESGTALQPAGYCAACADYDPPDGCNYYGLPDAGATDCRAECSDTAPAPSPPPVPQILYGTEYSWHNTNVDLKAFTKYQKANPQGIDVPPFYRKCAYSDDGGCAYSDDGACPPAGSCQPLQASWRADVDELTTPQWEAGTRKMFIDGLELTKGYYLEQSVPKGSSVSTYAMPPESFSAAHPNDNVYSAFKAMAAFDEAYFDEFEQYEQFDEQSDAREPPTLEDIRRYCEAEVNACEADTTCSDQLDAAINVLSSDDDGYDYEDEYGPYEPIECADGSCPDGHFCNFDEWGPTCERCGDCGAPDGCWYCGLPDAGAEDCARTCLAEEGQSELLAAIENCWEIEQYNWEEEGTSNSFAQAQAATAARLGPEIECDALCQLDLQREAEDVRAACQNQ